MRGFLSLSLALVTLTGAAAPVAPVAPSQAVCDAVPLPWSVPAEVDGSDAALAAWLDRESAVYCAKGAAGHGSTFCACWAAGLMAD